MKTPDQVAAKKMTDRMQALANKRIAAAGVPDEAQMRDAEAAHPKSLAKLTEYIASLVERPHDYGTCVYAMSLAATAAFNFVAGRLGVTGFQASCADLDVIRRTRGLKHGFLLLNGWEVLYPQYDLVENARKFVEEMREKLKDEAKKLLRDQKGAASTVIAHWRELAR